MLTPAKKGILKTKKFESPETGLSNSIGAVSWTLPDEALHVSHSSVPSRSSQPPRQKDLKDLRSLQECVKFITQWKQQVEHVCQCGASVSDMSVTDSRRQEQCRSLILEWAQGLKKAEGLFSEGTWRQERDASWVQKENQAVSAKHSEQKIMEWAKELQTVSEHCGVRRHDLALFLKQLELNKRKSLSLLPFLEFLTWSLLKQENQGLVPQLWLLSKHQTWKIVDITLDPMTNHPWLLLSDDKKKVQEALNETEVAFSTQRFDGWPCVLGWEGLTSGRYYWEVDIANNGYWKIGVTTTSSKRHGRSPMNPSDGFWTLWKSTRQFYACTKPETELPLSFVPKRLGVYLDYEEGQVSFYNVETRTHIFTFTANFHEKLYPLFAPLDGRTLITISSTEVNPDVGL
ncbi:hypothetical protein DNTS_012073 [Danionella cerebrum]|uniref:B30.2/SPRY domain-containing protein n=1 Tax=Danionella cerebrum TaxID=2873325 RepID=A0A553PV37_9TELE|nr:hypothetical protein DNTS_012073 [Danionella translucida]